MYKRFVRWASDRLDDDGIIGFITNRKYIEAQQDDGFRKLLPQEFSHAYVVDLGGDVRKTAGAGNVFGIMTGVAIAFLVRQSTQRGHGEIHYFAIDDARSGPEKLAQLQESSVADIDFQDIEPDSKHNWLNKGHPDFENLTPLVSRRTKLAKTAGEEMSVFGLRALGVNTARDEWVYDFGVRNLRDKALFFADTYNELLAKDDRSYPPIIKWSSTLHDIFNRGERLVYNDGKRLESLYRPFVSKHYFAETGMSDRLTTNHYQMFGEDLKQPNKVIYFQTTGGRRPFAVLVSDRIADWHIFFDGTQCLPLYRYTAEGERVSNITEWGIRRINDHYRKEWGEDFDKTYPDGIGAEELFAYTYAVLHDPVYRYDYANDLLREFPRLPLYHEFDIWARMGRELLDVHVGFESVEPYGLERRDKDGVASPKPRLRADKERGIIVLDEQTSLAGVPPDAWRYRLGSRSALEWVLDQYKEKKPRDRTIRERFNAYRFADHKERVIDLLQRVCAVSVKTMEIVDGMAYWEDGYLIVFGDRDKHEWSMMGVQAMFSEPEDEEWLKSWLEM